MNKARLLLAASLLLGLAGCAGTAVTQSGGSGLDEGYSAWSDSPKSCLADDTNCIEFYNSPGGG